MIKPVLFNTGRTFATRAVADLMHQGFNVTNLISRHVTGDWGDLGAEDKEANDYAVAAGDLRILSAYQTEHGRMYVLTEADRSYTTVMLAWEY